MILTCPNCQTSFTIPDGAIGDAGRRVRCANCQHSWRATKADLRPATPVAARPARPPSSPPPSPRTGLTGSTEPTDPANLARGMAPPPGFDAARYMEENTADAEDESIDDAHREDISRLRADLLNDPAPQTDADRPADSGDEPELDGEPGRGDADDHFEDAGAAPEHSPPDSAADEALSDGEALDDGDVSDLGTSGADTLLGGLERLAAELRPGEADGPATDRATIDDDEDFSGFNTDLSVDGAAQSDEDFLGRRRAQQRADAAGERRKRKAARIGWLALIIFWTAVLLGGFLFRAEIVSIMPGAERIYRLLDGLSQKAVFRAAGSDEDLSASITDEPEVVVALLTESRREEIAGVDTLVIRGHVKNNGRRAATVPKVLIEVLNTRGDVIDSWQIDPPGRTFTRGAEVDFTTTRSPYPTGGAEVAVRVLEGTRSAGEGSLP